MDALLARLMRTAWRRARQGEWVWAAVAVSAWAVRRVRRRAAEPLWRGEVAEGERLVVTTRQG